MWVMKVTNFLELQGLPGHEELRRKQLIVRRQKSFRCIFVSHQ